MKLTYNGLGDVITRTDGNTTTRYFYNYVLGLNPIVTEATDVAPQRYYVWAPSGALLYMIDAADGNKVYYYHFDRTGSTIALTDASGAVTDAYAYDLYGKLLAHEGKNTQPFTFVGKWGVRQEGASGSLYQMRARYYDATTARFLSREPLWPQTSEPRLLNPYQYALGDPIGMIDVTGAEPTPTGFSHDYVYNDPDAPFPSYFVDGQEIRIFNANQEPIYLPRDIVPPDPNNSWDLFTEIAKAILGPDASPEEIEHMANNDIIVVNMRAARRLQEINRARTGSRAEAMAVLERYETARKQLAQMRQLLQQMIDFRLQPAIARRNEIDANANYASREDWDERGNLNVQIAIMGGQLEKAQHIVNALDLWGLSPEEAYDAMQRLIDRASLQQPSPDWRGSGNR